MASKKVTYQQFLELITIDVLIINEVQIFPDGVLAMGSVNFVYITLPKEFEFEDKETVVHIKTNHFWLTLWKEVAASHLSIFDVE